MEHQSGDPVYEFASGARRPAAHRVRRGGYRCYQAATGKALKTIRAIGPISASMVATQERIYIVEESGRTTVLANDASWNVLAINDIGEQVVASPAISDGDLVIRSKQSLFLIRN